MKALNAHLPAEWSGCARERAPCAMAWVPGSSCGEWLLRCLGAEVKFVATKKERLRNVFYVLRLRPDCRCNKEVFKVPAQRFRARVRALCRRLPGRRVAGDRVPRRYDDAQRRSTTLNAQRDAQRRSTTLNDAQHTHAALRRSIAHRSWGLRGASALGPLCAP